MEKIHELAFRTIQIRSQISEALCLYASEWGSTDSILNAGWRSLDVIEHIAQYAIDGVGHEMQATLLVKDLNVALLLISEFESELKKTCRNVPSPTDVSALISEIKDSFQVDLEDVEGNENIVLNSFKVSNAGRGKNTVIIAGEIKHIWELDPLTLSSEWSKLKDESNQISHNYERMFNGWRGAIVRFLGFNKGGYQHNEK